MTTPAMFSGHRPRILITGTARSGTKTMAYLLMNAGFDIQHEQPGRLGIVDWHKAPQAANYHTVIHQVREPLSCISSLRTIAPQSAEYIYKQLHKLNYDIDDNIDSIAFYVGAYLHWNHLAGLHATHRHRIEDIRDHWPQFLKQLGLPDAPYTHIDPLNTRATRHRSHTPPVTWPRICENAPHLTDALAMRAAEYGYDICTD